MKDHFDRVEDVTPSESVSIEAYTVGEVARKLSVSKRTVNGLIASGKLQSLILPGTLRARRVTRAQLDHYVRCGEIDNGFRRPRRG